LRLLVAVQVAGKCPFETLWLLSYHSFLLSK